jgi:hypothetical protein
MITNEMRRRALTATAGALAVLGLAVYVVTVVEARFNLANSPIFPIVLMTVPFGIVLLVLRFSPRAGRVVAGVFAAGLGYFLGSYLVANGLTGWWADVVSATVGTVLALTTLVVVLLPAAGRGARARDAAPLNR